MSQPVTSPSWDLWARLVSDGMYTTPPTSSARLTSGIASHRRRNSSRFNRCPANRVWDTTIDTLLLHYQSTRLAQHHKLEENIAAPRDRPGKTRLMVSGAGRPARSWLGRMFSS